MGAWIEAHPLRTLGLILILTLLLDAGWLWAHPPSLESGETAHWWPIVVNVAQGRGYVGCFPEYFPFCGPGNEATASREPVPVGLFAAVVRWRGESLRAAAQTEILINLALVIALFLLARELAGGRVATTAALLWVFYLPALKLIPQVSGELLAGLGLTWGLYFFLRFGKTLRRREALASGIGIGIAALSRSAVLGIVPALILGAAWPPGKLRARWKPLLVFGAALAATLAPWAIRNDAVFGRPVIASTLSGYNLFRENHALGSRDYLRFIGGEEAQRAIEGLIARRGDLRGDENEARMQEVYLEGAVKIIRAHPLRYLLLSAHRSLLLWFDWGYLEAYGRHPQPREYAVMAQQAILLILAVVGLRAIGWRGWPLGVTLAVWSLLHIAVISQLRFLVPVMPQTMTLSALGARRLGQLRSGFRSPRGLP